jgi:hypothetical protein
MSSKNEKWNQIIEAKIYAFLMKKRKMIIGILIGRKLWNKGICLVWGHYWLDFLPF